MTTVDFVTVTVKVTLYATVVTQNAKLVFYSSVVIVHAFTFFIR